MLDLRRLQDRLEHGDDGRGDAAVRTRVLRVVRRRQERRPRGVHVGRCVAIGVRRADRRHRAPQEVVVLRLHAGDAGVGRDHGAHRQQPRRVVQVEAVRRGDVAEHLVVLVDHVGVPELPDRGLSRRPREAARRAEQLDLVDVRGVLGARQRGRRRRAELRRRVEHERRHRPDPRGLGRLGRRRRREHPRPRRLRRDAERRRDRRVASVVEREAIRSAAAAAPTAAPACFASAGKAARAVTSGSRCTSRSASQPAPGSSRRASSTPPTRPRPAPTPQGSRSRACDRAGHCPCRSPCP